MNTKLPLSHLKGLSLDFSFFSNRRTWGEGCVMKHGGVRPTPSTAVRRGQDRMCQMVWSPESLLFSPLAHSHLESDVTSFPCS